VNGPANRATSGSTGTTGTGQNCDPNTGICSPAGGSTTGTGGGATGSGASGAGTTGTTGITGTTVNSAVGSGSTGEAASDTPITLAGNNGSGLEVTLMALAAGMMFLLSVVPPLLAQAGKRSRQRRGIDEFYDSNDWPGNRK
jgi:hypothetical protein